MKFHSRDNFLFPVPAGGISPEQLANPPKTIMLDRVETAMPENVFTPKYTNMEESAKVDVITVGDVIVTIAKK